MTAYNDERLIDNLLIYMNDDLEKKGLTPNLVHFSFDVDEEDNLALGSLYGWMPDEVIKVVKVCRSRNYVKNTCINCGLVSQLALTTSGQRRAIAAKLEQNKPREAPVYRGTPNPTPQHIIYNSVGFNTQDPVIKGDNNTQGQVAVGSNITQISKDSKVNNPPTRKESFFKHPMTTTVVAVIGGIVAAVIGAYLTIQGGK